MNARGPTTDSGTGATPSRADRIEDRFSHDQIDDHLSEDQIDDRLIGDLARPAAAHLAGCEFCEFRVAAAATAIERFNAVTLAWGERRSATLPLHRTMAKSAKFHPRLAWAAAVVLAAGLAIPVASHQVRQERRQTAQASASAGETIAGDDVSAGDQIVRDNQMLKAIDRELDASVDSPAALGLQPVGSPAESRPVHPSSVQD